MLDTGTGGETDMETRQTEETERTRDTEGARDTTGKAKTTRVKGNRINEHEPKN